MLPEQPYGKTGGPGGFLPDGVATPEDTPSRDRAPNYGSARFQVYQCRLNRIITRSGSIIGPLGSLAPPALGFVSPFRPFAGAPFVLSPFRPFAMLLPYDDPSRCN